MERRKRVREEKLHGRGKTPRKKKNCMGGNDIEEREQKKRKWLGTGKPARERENGMVEDNRHEKG
jgi:hypothetical protein